ncbi:MAG TPA: stage III sporulation protein AA [Clostridiales bacterium]|nr:stage III sporulation protein AA [Clostridiales bacterium]
MKVKDSLERFSLLTKYLPKRLNTQFEGCSSEILCAVEEIRLRMGQPLTLLLKNELCFLGNDGLTDQRGQAFCVEEGDLKEAWRLVTASSVYALEEELRRGYITLPGGHRVGIAGKAVLSAGKVKTQKEITSLNYRVAKEIRGGGEKLLPFLYGEYGFENTLVFSSPCAGKTTLLRDLTRLLSNGSPPYPPHNVTVVDERSELAGTFMGKARFDIGDLTDVLDAFPKSEGMLLAVRSLSPAVIVTDEIGGEEDRYAVTEAVRSGIRLLLSVHAGSLAELTGRPVVSGLIKDGVFGRLVHLSRRCGPGTVEGVYLRKMKEGSPFYDKSNVIPADRDGSGPHRYRAV